MAVQMRLWIVTKCIGRYARDPHGSITQHLLEYPTPTSYEATEHAYDYESGMYECYLCTGEFRNLRALNQHLSSPAHEQKLYNCPNRNCRRPFSTLGALVNHIESETCGFMNFRAVQRNVQTLVDPN